MSEHALFQKTDHKIYLYVILKTLHSKHVLNLDIYIFVYRKFCGIVSNFSLCCSKGLKGNWN